MSLNRRDNMKPETMMYEMITQIIPENSDKTIFFASITKTSYEIFFYSFINGEPKQCYTLAEEGKLDENKLAEVFDSIADIIRDSKIFKKDKINIATIRFENLQLSMDMEYYEKDVRMYKVKKEWKENNI